MYYILDENKRVQPATMEEFAAFINANDGENKLVRQIEILGYDVSTVFLGLDHSFDQGGEPIVFETMIFGSEHEYAERYKTYEEAMAGALSFGF